MQKELYYVQVFNKILSVSLLFLILGFQNSCNSNDNSPISPGDESLINEILNKVNTDSLINTVAALSNEKGFIKNSVLYNITSRHSSENGNELAFEYLKQRLNEYNLKVNVENFRENGYNIIAELPGKKYPERKLIICAHYDDMPDSIDAPGADDNASGCAVVIEAARVLSKYDLNYTVVFALWDFEEQGLFGSIYHAEQSFLKNEVIEAVLNVDMVGYDKNEDCKVLLVNPEKNFPFFLAEQTIAINRTFKIGLNPQTSTAQLNSDQIPFSRYGYDSILMIEDLTGEKNPVYHTANDKVENFNKQYFLKCAKLAVGTLTSLAISE